MPRDLHDLFGVKPMALNVPARARVIAQAILRFKRRGHGPPTENEIIWEAKRMRAEGLHNMNIGSNTNLRNGLQRSWAGSTIYKNKWGKPPHNYAPIFIRLEPTYQHPLTRWDVVEGFVP